MNNNFKVDKLELPGELGLGEMIKFVSNNIYGILIVIVMIILGTAYVVYNNIADNEGMSTLSNIHNNAPELKNIEILNNLEKKEHEDDKSCIKLKDTYDRECKVIKDKFNCDSRYCCTWSKMGNGFQCVGDKKEGFANNLDGGYYQNKQNKQNK